MGWKSKPDNKAQKKIAKEQLELARSEVARQRERDAIFDPLYQQLINTSMESQRTQDARSAEQWDWYKQIGMPAEQRMADAAAGYDSQGRRDAEAAEAVAGLDAQFQRARDAQSRDLGRAGISLDSGRALTLDSAGRFAQAKGAAAADRAARKQTEMTGLSLTDAVANRGRGIAGTGLQAAQLALGAGGQAGSQIGASGVGHAQGIGSAQNLYGSSLGGYNAASALKQQADASNMAGLAGLGSFITAPLGLGGAAGGAGSIFGKGLSMLPALSDPKTKTVHGRVSDKSALRKIDGAPVYDWTYKRGLGDGKRHIGRMAGDGDVDTPQGKAIDVVSELGTHHAAIRELSRQVRRLSLVDANAPKEAA